MLFNATIWRRENTMSDGAPYYYAVEPKKTLTKSEGTLVIPQAPLKTKKRRRQPSALQPPAVDDLAPSNPITAHVHVHHSTAQRRPSPSLKGQSPTTGGNT